MSMNNKLREKQLRKDKFKLLATVRANINTEKLKTKDTMDNHFKEIKGSFKELRKQKFGKENE